MKMTNLDMQSEATRFNGSETALGELEAFYEGPSRQRGRTRVSTSTKLPDTNKVTPPIVTPLVDNGASMEEALTRVVDSMSEQNE